MRHMHSKLREYSMLRETEKEERRKKLALEPSIQYSNFPSQCLVRVQPRRSREYSKFSFTDILDIFFSNILMIAPKDFFSLSPHCYTARSNQCIQIFYKFF